MVHPCCVIPTGLGFLVCSSGCGSFYTVTTACQGSDGSPSLPPLLLCLFLFSPPGGCVLVSHCGFSLHFPDGSWSGAPVWVLRQFCCCAKSSFSGEVSGQVESALLSRCPSFPQRFVGVLHGIWMWVSRRTIYVANIFSLSVDGLFTILMISFHEQKFSILI